MHALIAGANLRFEPLLGLQPALYRSDEIIELDYGGELTLEFKQRLQLLANLGKVQCAILTN